jgi:acyl-CoA thioester hydrolase
MFIHETAIRVRYAETDQMGYVYYGNYAQYFEVGRVETLRELGLTYKQIENDGIMLPVFSFSIKYFKPAFYDDNLIIRTIIKEVPLSRIIFEYETINEQNEILNKAETVLVFINRETKKPCRAPKELTDRLSAIIRK